MVAHSCRRGGCHILPPVPELDIRTMSAMNSMIRWRRRSPVLDDVSLSIEGRANSSLCSVALPVAASRHCCGWSPDLKCRVAAGCCGEDDVRIKGPHPSRVVVFQDPTLFSMALGLGTMVALGFGGRKAILNQASASGSMRRSIWSGFPAFANALSASALGRYGPARLRWRAHWSTHPKILILDEPLRQAGIR